MSVTEKCGLKYAAELLSVDIVNSVPNAQRHHFSIRYKIKKHKLLRTKNSFYYQATKTAPRRALYYAVLVILTAALLTGVCVAATVIFKSFTVREENIFSSVCALDDPNAPREITEDEKYMIGADMSGYSATVMSDDFMEYWIVYEKDEYIINFSQLPKCIYKEIRLNTEASPNGITRMELNGKEALYYQTRDFSNCITLDMGDYIVEIDSNIDKNTLIETAKLVEKIEK